MFTKQMGEKVNKILNEVQVLNEEGEDVFIKFSDCNIDIADILWDEVEVLDWTIIWKICNDEVFNNCLSPRTILNVVKMLYIF